MNRDKSLADCQFCLVLPAALEQDAVDALLASDRLVAELLVLAADTPLAMAAPVSAMERVRGRSRRALLLVVTRASDVQPLLQGLDQALNGARLDWWTTPLAACGTTGGESA